MAKKYRTPSKIDPNELAIFKAAVMGVKPLSKSKSKVQLKPAQTKPETLKRKTLLTEDENIDLYDKNHLENVRSDEFIAYKQSSISNKILRKLRKGQYNVEALLDLHGMSVHEAKKAVKQFLQDSLQQDLRVIVIIHGKGKNSLTPILKNRLNHWLRGVDCVLAFCSASSSHGRHGAIYVLLKRRTLLE